ncbi:hypothetical protein F909_04058 [Acinetobacter sp. ANC 3929]|uniref:hypothetical protein n=1 Tax=unclassified Acinetobacter TaxID=196816 RepID=UPI0002CEBBBC|nr:MULTISPECIES: hypothetical protein [unclassified Acinetobacter]ENW78369.1 hypothetical protein F909_04058 [Acinetobacter sp. ANC 3929]MCH7353317.1 hypothetical protein [Acinetobacter sp. NIPH 2023]MCH7360699.1 hypothetical protein [Acinetobacter sp. NIPH 2024]
MFDIEKEREAFKALFEEKLGAHSCQFDLDSDGNYEDRETVSAWHMYLAGLNKNLEGCVVVPETLSLDLARKRAEYIYQGAKNYLAREYANLSAIEMQLFKERWIESKAVSLQTDYLLTLESARGGK